jgi:hypothetical protein
VRQPAGGRCQLLNANALLARSLDRAGPGCPRPPSDRLSSPTASNSPRRRHCFRGPMELMYDLLRTRNRSALTSLRCWRFTALRPEPQDVIGLSKLRTRTTNRHNSPFTSRFTRGFRSTTWRRCGPPTSGPGSQKTQIIPRGVINADADERCSQGNSGAVRDGQ